MYRYTKLLSESFAVLTAVALVLVLPLSVQAFERDSRQFRGYPEDYLASTHTPEEQEFVETNLLTKNTESRQFMGYPGEYAEGEQEIPITGAVEEEMGPSHTDVQMQREMHSRGYRQFMGFPSDYAAGEYEVPMTGAVEEETRISRTDVEMQRETHREMWSAGSRQFRGFPQDFLASTYTPEEHKAGVENDKLANAGSRQFRGYPSEYEEGEHEIPITGAVEEEMGTSGANVEMHREMNSEGSRQFRGFPEDYSPR